MTVRGSDIDGRAGIARGGTGPMGIRFCPPLAWVLFLEPSGDFARRRERHLRRRPHVADELLEHLNSISATDELRVTGERVDTARAVGDHVVELSLPDLLHGRRRHVAGVAAPDELERREVVEVPAR